MKGRLLSFVQALLIALVILTGAIALPILFRPFFYWHITPFDLSGRVGLTVEQVKTAYNEMMDFCIGLSREFSVGTLPFSQSGADHFADVRKLFLLDLGVLTGAALLLLVVLLLKRKGSFYQGAHTPGFWSAIGLGVMFVIVGGSAAQDFNKAFVVFHKIFFPGKDNWVFYSDFDPVIKMLPAEFFRNSAMLILGAILLACIGLILWDLLKRKKTHRL